jgi:hypothetical protein
MVFLLAFVSELCAFDAKGTVWPNQSQPLGGPGLTAASTLQIRVRQDRGSVTPILALRWATRRCPSGDTFKAFGRSWSESRLGSTDGWSKIGIPCDQDRIFDTPMQFQKAFDNPRKFSKLCSVHRVIRRRLLEFEKSIVDRRLHPMPWASSPPASQRIATSIADAANARSPHVPPHVDVRPRLG